MDSSAMVVICGGIPSFYSGTGSYQEMDAHYDDEQFEIFKPVLVEAIRAERLYVLDVITTQESRSRASGHWAANDILSKEWTGEPV